MYTETPRRREEEGQNAGEDTRNYSLKPFPPYFSRRLVVSAFVLSSRLPLASWRLGVHSCLIG